RLRVADLRRNLLVRGRGVEVNVAGGRGNARIVAGFCGLVRPNALHGEAAFGGRAVLAGLAQIADFTAFERPELILHVERSSGTDLGIRRGFDVLVARGDRRRVDARIATRNDGVLDGGCRDAAARARVAGVAVRVVIAAELAAASGVVEVDRVR